MTISHMKFKSWRSTPTQNAFTGLYDESEAVQDVDFFGDSIDQDYSNVLPTCCTCWKENIILWRATKAMITACILHSYWCNNPWRNRLSLFLLVRRENTITPSKHIHFPPDFRPLTSQYFGLTSHKCHLWQHRGGYRWWPKGLFITCLWHCAYLTMPRYWRTKRNEWTGEYNWLQLLQTGFQIDHELLVWSKCVLIPFDSFCI